jgi:hypothetical protein
MYYTSDRTGGLPQAKLPVEVVSRNRDVIQTISDEQWELASSFFEANKPRFFTRPSHIHYGWNSPFQAVNLAILWPEIIILVGFIAWDPLLWRHNNAPPKTCHRWIRTFEEAGNSFRRHQNN